MSRHALSGQEAKARLAARLLKYKRNPDGSRLTPKQAESDARTTYRRLEQERRDG